MQLYTMKFCISHDSVTVMTYAKFYCDQLYMLWIFIKFWIWSKYRYWDRCQGWRKYFIWLSHCSLLHHFNTFAPGRCGSYFKSVIFKHMLWIWTLLVNCSQLNATEHILWQVTMTKHYSRPGSLYVFFFQIWSIVHLAVAFNCLFVFYHFHVISILLSHSYIYKSSVNHH